MNQTTATGKPINLILKWENNPELVTIVIIVILIIINYSAEISTDMQNTRSNICYCSITNDVMEK